MSHVEVKEAERTAVCDNGENITSGNSVGNLRNIVLLLNNTKLEFNLKLQHHQDFHRKLPHRPKEEMC